MPFIRTGFHRLLEGLDRRSVRAATLAHDGDFGVGSNDRSWTCERHLKALLFGQFAGLQHQRQIVAALAARPSALYHVNLRAPRLSTLSDALRERPAEVYRDICIGMMDQLGRSLRQEGGSLVQLIDASPIPIRDGRFGWVEADARCRGLKLHLVYDPRAVRPVHFALTSPRVGDLTQARALPIQSGATLVFDKGYTDYGWWQDIVASNASFVTRLKGNACRREIVPNAAVGPGILQDRSLKIGHRQPRGGALNPLFDTTLREIVVEREGKAPLCLITNDHDRSAVEIAELYRERWQIELFFKWIKQNLRIRSFFGRSENAVKTQIYVALIAFILLRIFQTTHASSHKGSITTLLTRLKVALFHPFSLLDGRSPIPKHPTRRPPAAQMAFDLP